MIDSMQTTIRTASLGLIAAGLLMAGGARAERVGDTVVALTRAEVSSCRVNHRRHRCWPDA